MIAIIVVILAILTALLCANAWGLMLAAKLSKSGKVPFRKGLLITSLCLLLNGALLLVRLLGFGHIQHLLPDILTTLAHSLGAVVIVGYTLRLKPWRAFLVTLLGALIGLALMIPVGVAPSFLIRTTIGAPFKIPSDTMAPTLRAGDRIFVSKIAYRQEAPERWDVAVFRYPPDRRRRFIKRVVGLPGEVIEIRDGTILVNGMQLETPTALGHIHWNNQGQYGETGQRVQIPENSYFLLGDNSSKSHDSRFWGFVRREDFIGKATYIFWPLDRIGDIR